MADRLIEKLGQIKEEIEKIRERVPFNKMVDRISDLVISQLGDHNRFTPRLMALKPDNNYSSLLGGEQKALIIEIDAILDELEYHTFTPTFNPASQKNPSKNTTMKKIFISHAFVDHDKIAPLIDLITDIGVPHGQIFFSSSAASGVGLGENIFDRLKKELNEDVLALFLLSENFYKSAVSLCEMGAVWIKSGKQIPILIPPFDFADVKGVFPNSLGFKLNDKDQLNSFKQELETIFNLPPLHFSRWEAKRDEYLNKVNATLN